MSDEQQPQGTAWTWAAPLRKAASRIRPTGAADLDDDDGDLPGRSVVDCAVYVEGRRRPGACDYDSGLATVSQTPGSFLWLGLHEPSEADFAPIAKRFGLDELAVEAATTRRQRPKIEHFADVALFVLRTTRYVEHTTLTETCDVVETGSVVLFIGDAYVISVRHGPAGELAPVRSDLEKRPDRLAQGPWAVAHAVADRLVDSYLEVAVAFENDIDELEDHVFAPQSQNRAAQIYQLKRELMEFKRAVAPLQHPLAALIDDKEGLPKEIRRYFRDVNDHLLRTVERIVTYDDLLNSILQARLAQLSVDQNNDMRKIAAWAAIAAAQTAIAGIYGMNFDYMPELHWKYGYVIVLALMFVVASTMYRAFRRSGWL
ncbi:magnesium/cobalt transporter CorA [Catellatospora citrea]|uniref:Magnesium transport protein CorA n=1 Tax=Catellatospora citrea TaxID=53366 RepID=A0A8J3NY63_9ACTN|nr:magnesium/cobalt transporter CorA [Catellatospora citrea]RKE06853.1 magnesium transporter [Catellatospora citrea]GIF95000.1 magnesium transport protein CorA [Catellatospora citrea]